MDLRFTPTPQDAERVVSVYLFASTVDIAEAAADAAHELDLTPFVSNVTQRPSELSFSLAWHNELYGAAQPKPGRVVSLLVDDVVVFVGVIESVSDYRVSTGTRTMSLTCRTRDASPMWREVPRVSQEYEQGTQLGVIARDIAQDMGLADGEILLPTMTTPTLQSSTQFAAVPAWTMLETLLFPSGHVPFTDGLGRLRAYSHDTARTADISLTEDRIIAVAGSRARPALTRLRLTWRDPNLRRVSQQDKMLAQAMITAGFFQLHQHQDLWWSDDQTQRAVDTHLVIRQSANSGLLPFCSENYAPIESGGIPGEFGGTIHVRTSAFAPFLATLSLYTLVTAGGIPDGVASLGAGSTIPIGRLVHVGAEATILLVMMSIGTGSYEIWGTPYDYVYGRNTTEAFDPDAPSWVDKVETVECDFMVNEGHAQVTVAREFVYRARATSNYGVTIVDDLRVEVGDILTLPDATRVYVSDYTRNLSPGAPAVLDIQGFQV